MVLAALIIAGVLSYRAFSTRGTNVPIAIIAALAATVLVLGLASFWRCSDEDRPRVIYPLIWTIAMFTGDTSIPDGANCFTVAPAALNVARLSAFATVFLGALWVAGALLQSRLDRLRVALSRAPVTVVVEIDGDAASIVCAILASSKSGGPLVLITDQPERSCVLEARNHGARIIAVDFDRPETMTALSLWRRLERLYLLSPDAWANEVRLEQISTQTAAPKDQRLQLVVRIDDPWQAEAWRAQLFGRPDGQWAADAVGLYEVTAHRLLDDVLARPDIKRLIVCGTSRLTLALCSELAQRHAERDYYTAPGQHPLPRMTTVAPDAAEYHRDHEHRLSQLGFPPTLGLFDVVEAIPSVATLAEIITDGSTTDPARVAMIFVDQAPDPAAFDSTTATRLAARFRTTPIFAWEPEARLSGLRRTAIGQLRTFRLALHLPDDEAPDRWERAAMLIHSRFAGATQPWSTLDTVHKDATRQLVTHMLRIVEEIGEHTWNTWNGFVPEPVPIPYDAEPLVQLQLMGFDREAAVRMAKAEHERSLDYHHKHPWRRGTSGGARELQPLPQDWAAIEADPLLYQQALTMVAVTLLSLRELGYRSRPVWERFDRAGYVIAERGTADGGDWEVRDPSGGDSWSVRDGIFRATHQSYDDAPNHYRRVGTVLARRAPSGDLWIVKGEQGETGTVPEDQFSRRYRRTESDSAATTQNAVD
ncbi:MAG: hypothetical protein U5N53_14890 [Mycobacterium sp.]|nr:hypothetical protein [Mycobacterium sp.]